MLCLSYLSCGQVHAGTIFNNFGLGEAFVLNDVYQASNTFIAATFTTTGEGILKDVLIPVFTIASPVMFGLYADTSGKPGALLVGIGDNLGARLEASPGSAIPAIELNSTAAVPEPATIVLLGISLADLGFSRRRKQH
jgi:hypothetical protein